MNIFDGLEESTFNIVANTMGYQAVWSPSDGGVLLSAIVLYKNPSETARVLEVEYNPKRAMMEYFETDLPGLFEAVADKSNDETVVINGIEYGVNQVLSKFDGKSYTAHLQVL